MITSTGATYNRSAFAVANGSTWDAASKTGGEHDALLFNIISLFVLMLCCVLLIHLLLRLRLHLMPERCALTSVYMYNSTIQCTGRCAQPGGDGARPAARPVGASPAAAGALPARLPPVHLPAANCVRVGLLDGPRRLLPQHRCVCVPSLHCSVFSVHCSCRALGSILLLAVVGTMLSAAAITGGLVLVMRLDLCDVVAWHEAAAFGSLISAVDPVATLNVFRVLGVDRLLYMCATPPTPLYCSLSLSLSLSLSGLRSLCLPSRRLVFGESLANDAISIVLTKCAHTRVCSRSTQARALCCPKLISETLSAVLWRASRARATRGKRRLTCCSTS